MEWKMLSGVTFIILLAGDVIQPGAMAKSVAQTRPDPCALLTLEGAERIGGLPMTRTPMEGVFSRYQCSYQQKDGKAFEHASITFTLGGGHSKQDDEENWTNLKKGSTARGQTMDTKGLAGIGDEAFITRKKDPMSFQTILYVRKGGYHFILDAQDLKQEPVEALKEIGKKIAASL